MTAPGRHHADRLAGCPPAPWVRQIPWLNFTEVPERECCAIVAKYAHLHGVGNVRAWISGRQTCESGPHSIQNQRFALVSVDGKRCRSVGEPMTGAGHLLHSFTWPGVPVAQKQRRMPLARHPPAVGVPTYRACCARYFRAAPRALWDTLSSLLNRARHRRGLGTAGYCWGTAVVYDLVID